jgi:hypothetical protein
MRVPEPQRLERDQESGIRFSCKSRDKPKARAGQEVKVFPPEPILLQCGDPEVPSIISATTQKELLDLKPH